MKVSEKFHFRNERIYSFPRVGDMLNIGIEMGSHPERLVETTTEPGCMMSAQGAEQLAAELRLTMTRSWAF